MCDYENREAAMVVTHRKPDGTPRVWCDPCLVPLVTALNDGGQPTVASCCGHNGRGSDRVGEGRPGWIALPDGRVLLLLPDLDSARALVDHFAAALTDPAAAVARIKAEAGCELQRSGDGTHGPLIRQAKAEARKQALRESANEVHIEARFQTELMVRQGPEPHRYLTDRLSILETILRDRADRIDGTP